MDLYAPQATNDELRLLQETSLPLAEARKLTFKALRKGRALQYMAQLYTNNTVLMTVKREGRLITSGNISRCMQSWQPTVPIDTVQPCSIALFDLVSRSRLCERFHACSSV